MLCIEVKVVQCWAVSLKWHGLLPECPNLAVFILPYHAEVSAALG